MTLKLSLRMQSSSGSLHHNCTRPMKAGWSLFGKMKGIIRRDRKIRESDREWAWLYCIVYVSHKTMMFKYLSGSYNNYDIHEMKLKVDELRNYRKCLKEECVCVLASEPTDCTIPKLVILVSILFCNFTVACGTIYCPLYLQRLLKRYDLWMYKLKSHSLSITLI